MRQPVDTAAFLCYSETGVPRLQGTQGKEGIGMSATVRLLGIAPYNTMKTLMMDVAQEYPEIDLTVFVGDLQQGVELARSNFRNDYDAVVSRGGTAYLLRSTADLGIPVIEIPVLPQDILRAMTLAENLEGRCAIVGFPNITVSAEMLCHLVSCNFEIHSVNSQEEVMPTLLSLREKGTRTILCDKIAYTTALQLGLDVILITSGAEAVQKAFQEAIRLYHNYQRLREENRFLRSLIWNQVNHTVVLDDRGRVFFSTLTGEDTQVLDFLRQEALEPCSGERRLLKQISNVRYKIVRRQEQFQDRSYTTYFFTESRVPSGTLQRGIRYVSAAEAREQFQDSLYGMAGLMREFQPLVEELNPTHLPIMIYGEDGTCKEQAVNFLYLHSRLADSPLVILDCAQMDDRAWDYLLGNHNSPLAQNDCTIFTKNVDALTGEQRQQLLSGILDADLCRRNRMIFSSLCRRDEKSTEAGRVFVERLSCMTICLPPLRERKAQIPIIVNICLSHLNEGVTRPRYGLQADAMQRLQDFSWPSNYMQLERILKELSLRGSEPYITLQEVESVLGQEKTVATVNANVEEASRPLDLSGTLESISREIVGRVLAEENGNQTRTARRLGISRTTLWRMLNQS